MDIAHLRDLLSLLREHRVEAFSAGGLQVTFKDDEVSLPLVGRSEVQVVEDESRSTSSKRVKGFSDTESTNIWDNPALWPAQGGRRLRFDGSLE